MTLVPIVTRSMEARQRCIDASKDAVTRYVITHIGKYGFRTLAEPAQGRYTYPTAAQAQEHLDAIMGNNDDERLRSVFGLPLLVMPVLCWPGHHDPIGIYP